jgi:hypothetical protein
LDGRETESAANWTNQHVDCLRLLNETEGAEVFADARDLTQPHAAGASYKKRVT